MFFFSCLTSGEGLSASRNSLRAESRLSLLLNYLLPPSRVGTPAGSRHTTPVPTPQNTPPSTPKLSRLESSSSQQSEQGVPEIQPFVGDVIPTVIVHPPEEDGENREVSVIQKKEHGDVYPGNYCSSTCVVHLDTGMCLITLIA